MRLFRRKQTAEPTDIVAEKWQTSFSVFQDHRFEAFDDDGYKSRIENGRLRLDLFRKNLFAWTDDPLYRYDDFLLTAVIGIAPGNGYSSTGFLIRRTAENSYYYFLVSDKGYFRLDTVLNGTPSVLIDWTSAPDMNPEKFNISILADGAALNLFIEGQWVGSASDEGLSAGGISFAGQNYNESDNAAFFLDRIKIESRPAELEKAVAGLKTTVITDEAVARFAESRLKSGHYSAALIELKKILNKDSAEPELLLMAADCCMNLEMYKEAEAFLERIPPDNRGNRYLLQRAGILYMTNRFLELRDFLSDYPDLCRENHAASNLLGNAEYALGNWNNAYEAYKTAFELDEQQALYALNAARALEKSGDAADASVMYGNAARQYFRLGEYEELKGILPFLERLDKKSGTDGVETGILKAKLLFNDGSYNEANKIFTALIKNKTVDSTVYYLNALIEAGKGRNRKASSSFKKAAEIEPGYYLYHFKQAEYHFLTGGDYKASLKLALDLAPEDPWVLNLAGLAAVQEERPDAAIDFFTAAAASEPDSDEITVNLSEALFQSGRTTAALNLLDGETPAILNQRGNILSKQNDFAGAMKEYEAAYKIDRNSTDIILNLAAACIENDSFARAEELLVRVLDTGESAQAYNLMGNLSLLKGEYSRAEAAYRRAAELEPDFCEPVCNLSDLYISLNRLNDADLLLSGFKGEISSDRYNKLKDVVFRKRMSVFSCSACGEEWIVPKRIENQPPLKLVGEPPDNMPAGICSVCGKIYCIGCAKENLDGGRMICSGCNAPLKLSEKWMRYLYHEQGF